MNTWWKDTLDRLLKVLKTLIPAFAVAIYDHLHHRIKQEENKNKNLEMKLKIKNEQEELRDKNASTSDADLVDDFISDSTSREE